MGRRFRVNADLTTPKRYEPKTGTSGEFLEAVKVGGGDRIKAGAEVGEDELQGIYVNALIQSGRLTELAADPVKCPVCEESGSASAKKKKYASLGDLQAHYAEDHAALAPPEEVSQ